MRTGPQRQRFGTTFPHDSKIPAFLFDWRGELLVSIMPVCTARIPCVRIMMVGQMLTILNQIVVF